MLFYWEHGRFPPDLAEIDPERRAQVARQLGLEPAAPDRYDPLQRTWKLARAEIRARFGFREATVADAARLEAWLCGQGDRRRRRSGASVRARRGALP